MRFITPLKIVLMMVVLILAVMPAGSAVPPARAISAALGNFMADCSSFSVRLSVRAGEGKNAMYRTPDGSWVAVWVGGQELVWIPTSSIAVNVWQLTIPPTHLQGSGLTAGMNEANFVAGQPSLLGPAFGGFQVSAAAAPAGGITTW